MITPKQVETSHSGRDRRPPSKKHHAARSPKQQKKRRSPHRKPRVDQLFNALRDELGL
jgi:hypothetical protein